VENAKGPAVNIFAAVCPHLSELASDATLVVAYQTYGDHWGVFCPIRNSLLDPVSFRTPQPRTIKKGLFEALTGV